MSFGLLSTPQQQQQQQTSQSFQPFQNFNNSFPTQQPQSFLQPSFQQQQQQQQQQHQVLFLFTNDKAPANYSTKWSDLHPDSQKILQKIEERVLEYRDESLKLNQCSRLNDSSIINQGFEATSSHVLQDLSGITSTLERHKAQLQSLMAIAKHLLRNTEMAIRSYLTLRRRFNVGSTNPTEQTPSTTTAPMVDFYSGLPNKPSLFLQQTVARFETSVAECSQWISEIEQVLSDSDNTSLPSKSLLNCLPQVMVNVHDFFVHVAAKAEHIHQCIEEMKTAYLTEERSKGGNENPFAEADRREKAKSEAVAKRAHPTLHLPANQSNPQATVVYVAPSAQSTVATTNLSAPSMPFPAVSTPSGFSFAPSSSPSLFSSSFNTAASLFSIPFGSGTLAGSGSSFTTSTKSLKPKSRSSRR